MVLLLLFSLTP
uniref:Laminin subunit beta-1 n=1 Tax=Triatoma infestans TaxID=30076 RepID=A0A170ZRC4_TRIIF